MKYYMWIILFLMFSFDLKAADSSIVSLSIGNKYAFEGLRHCHGSFYDIKTLYNVQIISDTIINGHKYYEFYSSQNLPWEYDTNVVYFRADSSSIFKYNLKTNMEDTLLDFNDTVGTVYSAGSIIINQNRMYLLGNYFHFIQMDNGFSYASKLLLVQCFIGGICEENIELKSALLEGIYYGDSTLLSISNKINSNNDIRYTVLYQNYPNPFNPSTTIRYSIPKFTNVTIDIYDITGNLITNLFNQGQRAGTYEILWNGRNNEGLSVVSGVYYCRIHVGNFNKISKMILLK